MMFETALAAIRAQVPGVEGRVTVLAAGWDSDAYAIDGRFVVKRPRHGEAEARLRREAEVLALLRPEVTLAVPDLRLIEGPPLMSWHPMLPGGQLLAAEYDALDEAARDRLGRDLAGFLAEVHRVSVPFAPRVQDWPGAGALHVALPLVPPGLRRAAERALADYAALPPDPLGDVFGQFDGHGLNMAFDHATGRLNGVYDFGDAGIGARHRDFNYCGLTALDLMARVVGHYGAVTGLAVDLGRVRVLAGAHRLWELGFSAVEGRGDHVDRFALWCAGRDV